MANWLAIGGGALLVLIVLRDTFETIVLPRRVTQRVRLTRIFYHLTWSPGAAAARRWRPGTRREQFLSLYGPLSVLALLVIWALLLIVGFALLHWGFGSRVQAPDHSGSFWTDVYLSGTTFFTLGIGDVTPTANAGRIITVLEAGAGFGVLALVIGYMPTLYQAFARREQSVSTLDAWAGSPPSALGLLRRLEQDESAVAIVSFLKDWEDWAAFVLESHLSYPVLAYFRSQHENQSWLTALTAILDLSAITLTQLADTRRWQARLTFAMARHVALDLGRLLDAKAPGDVADRLPPADLARLREALSAAGYQLRPSPEADEQLSQLRALYEPYVHGMAGRLLLPLPDWFPADDTRDNWLTAGSRS
jgi:hypothetical protein